MKRKLKIMLSFMALVMLILFVTLSLFHKKQKSILEESTSELETNTMMEKENVINNAQENIIETNTIDTSNNIIANEVKETTTKVKTKELEEKPKTSDTKISISSSNAKTQITNESTKTKDEINNNKIVKPTTNENNPNINNNNNLSKQIELEETKQEQTIKKISQEEYNAEVQKYLKDIQAIKPGLKYKNIKKGQVFWPYRTSEIEIGVGNVSFGTIYYYVEVFVEGNQERFRYYIDWVGNE